MRNRRIIFNAFLLLIFTISLATANVLAQSDEVLVEGKPPFTESDFQTVVKFYERGLDIRFSDEQRDELKAKVIASWRKYQKSAGGKMVELWDMFRQFNTRIADEKIKARQHEFTKDLLADLQTMSRNGWSDYVIAVYENYRNSNGDDSTTDAQTADAISQNETSVETEKSDSPTNNEPNFQPVTGAIKMSDLVGKWNKGSVASYGYRNTVTNDYRSGYGAANEHQIYAGGSFDYSNYAQVSGYGCTTELFTSMKGRVSISGSLITFTYVSGTVKGKDSCKTEGFTKPAQIDKTTFRLERGKDGLRMCEIGGENPYCLYKES